MANRNFSLQDYFIQRGKQITPSMAFQGGDVENWQRNLKETVLQLLGDFPAPVNLNPEVIWRVEEDGLIKEKVVYDTEQHMSVPAIVLRRADLAPDQKHKALICVHGHGSFGKYAVAGVSASDEHRKAITQYNYNYGEQFARAGYITISPDLRNFGELGGHVDYPGRDSCNVHFIRGMLMGINLFTLHIWDVMRTLDYFISRDDVDPERVGCIGLSFGGTTTLHVAALDTRIKAAGVFSALTTYEEYAIKMANFCGSQFIPGIYRFADLADIAGLIAPRPLCVSNGIFDEGFPIEASITAHKRLLEIYASAGVADKLCIDIFEGGHRFSARKAFAFFESYL
jgi:dienelactone hydrolase